MKKVLLLCTAFLVSSASSADPSPSVRYLMNEPLTLFDWGLIGIQKELDSIVKFPYESTSGEYLYVRYNWPDNRLEINTRFYPRHSEVLKHGLEAICKDTHWTVKRHFNWNWPHYERNVKGIYGYFKHVGFVDKSAPESLQDDIESRTIFQTFIYTNNPEEGTAGIHRKRMICTSNYLDKEVRIELID